MEAIFKAGDVVQLNSGGPTMTIASPPEDGAFGKVIRALWFRDAALESAHFPVDALSRDSCQHGTPYRYACERCAVEDAPLPTAQQGELSDAEVEAAYQSAYEEDIHALRIVGLRAVIAADRLKRGDAELRARTTRSFESGLYPANGDI